MAQLDVAAIRQNPNIMVSGLARVCKIEQKVAKNNSQYILLKLGNITGSVPALCWLDSYHGKRDLEVNDIVDVTGRTTLLPDNHTVAIRLKDAAHVTCCTDNPVSLLPPHKNYNLADVQQLITLIESLQINQLKDFMYRVFSDENLAMTYLSGKSSQSYHHNEPGGLLRHSLQVAEIVSWHKAVVPDFHLEIGIVAALLHDVAKSKMWYNRPSAEVSAPILNHDLMTTEIVATQLRSLESDWKDGAAFLRDCLNYKANKEKYFRKRYHAPTIMNILWSADNTSAACYGETSVLKSKKAWQKNLQHGGERYYFYDSPPKKSSSQ